jgi:hypothetical protein
MEQVEVVDASSRSERPMTAAVRSADGHGSGRCGGGVMGRLRLLLAGILIGLLIGLVLLFGADLIALAQLALGRLRAST